MSERRSKLKQEAAQLTEALMTRLQQLMEHSHQAEREGLFQTQTDLTGLPEIRSAGWIVPRRKNCRRLN